MAQFQPDSAGLQPVPVHEHYHYAPEVVPGGPKPFEQDSHQVPPELYRDQSQPEVYRDQEQDKYPNDKPVGSHGPPPAGAGDTDKIAVSGPVDQKRRKRRRLIMWFGIVALAVVVIVAAVVGGVLGTKASQASSSPSAFNTKPNTGLAVLAEDGTETQYVYFQSRNSTISEVSYPGNDFTDGAASIVTSDARFGSPLAATSYTTSGTTWRALLYVQSSGQVMMTRAAGAGSWGDPVSILTNDTADLSSPALAACARTDSDGLNGIRVFYGSQSGLIREVGLDFPMTSPPKWNMMETFNGSDASSGAACSATNNYTHLYFQGNVGLHQWKWSYAKKAQSWQTGATAPAGEPMGSGSDVAAANDGTYTDYIFYQLRNGTVVRGSFFTSNEQVLNFINYGVGTAGTRLAVPNIASGANRTAVLLYENSTDSSGALRWDSVDGGGDVLQTGLLG